MQVIQSIKLFNHRHAKAQKCVNNFYNISHSLNARSLTKTGKNLNVHSSMDRKNDKRHTAIVLAFPLLISLEQHVNTNHQGEA